LWVRPGSVGTTVTFALTGNKSETYTGSCFGKEGVAGGWHGHCTIEPDFPEEDLCPYGAGDGCGLFLWRRFCSFIQGLAGASPRHEHPTARGERRRGRTSTQGKGEGTTRISRLARRLGIAGAVKIQVVVSPAGKVRSTKLWVVTHCCTGSTGAVRRWKFEPANEESSLVVEVKFKPVATVGS